MRTKLMATLLAGTLMCSTPAFAQGFPNPNNPNIQVGGNGNGNNGCGNGNGGNDGTGCQNNGGDTPGVGGNGTGIGIGVAGSISTSTATAVSGSSSTSVSGSSSSATGGNSTAAGGTAVATGGSVGDTTATGGSVGNTTATGGAGGNSGGNTFSNVTNYKRPYRYAAPSYAPTIIPGQCQKTRTFGISTFFGGISAGGSKSDQFCQAEHAAAYFQSIGRPDLACLIYYYSLPVVREAIKQSGVGCPTYAPSVINISTPPVTPVRPGERG